MTTTSLAELLDEVTMRAWTDQETGAADRRDASLALAYAAALLERLADRLPAWPAGTTEQRDRTLSDVVHRCRAVHTSRVTSDSVEGRRPASDPMDGSRGRLSELLAAASDLVNTMSPPLTPGERWATCAALMDPICACASVLRAVDTSTPILDLDRSLQQLRWWVRTHPAPGKDAARLDQARPSPVVEHGTPSVRLQHLLDAVTYQVETRDLPPHDGRVAAAAGLHIAVYAKSVTSTIGAADADTRASCDAMTSAWFALRDALRDVVDERTVSDLLPHVAELSHELTIRFGLPSAPDPTRSDATVPDTATTYRGLINRLPGLARGLARAAAQWGTERGDPAFDPSEPIKWRDRLGIERYAGIAPTRVPALAALVIVERALAAAYQSAVVAALADTTAMRVGHQLHPYLASAHREAADASALSLEAGPEIHWHPIVAGLDVRACRDAAWPMLARTLEHAARAGWDARANLPPLARDLPARQTALELTYRVLECCELPAGVCADPGPPSDRVGVPSGPDAPSVSAVHSPPYARPR